MLPEPSAAEADSEGVQPWMIAWLRDRFKVCECLDFEVVACNETESHAGAEVNAGRGCLDCVVFNVGISGHRLDL